MSTNAAGGMYTNALVSQEVEPRRILPRPENYLWWNDFAVPAPARYGLEGNEE